MVEINFHRVDGSFLNPLCGKGGDSMYFTYEYVYKIKGSRLKIAFYARSDEVANEIVRLNNLLVDHPMTRRVRKKKAWVEVPPYVLEQGIINRLLESCKREGIDPYPNKV